MKDSVSLDFGTFLTWICQNVPLTTRFVYKFSYLNYLRIQFFSSDTMRSIPFFFSLSLSAYRDIRLGVLLSAFGIFFPFMLSIRLYIFGFRFTEKLLLPGVRPRNFT